MRFSLLSVILLLGTFVPNALFGDESSRQPNVIVFLSDDQGWGDFGFQGNPNFKTPNLDRIASEGAVVQNFYVCPVCSPTRAEFLTGRYHLRGGVTGVSEGRERLNLGEVTIANLFANAGYQTAAFGKWHNGTQMPYHPNARGFTEYYGFCSGHWGHYFSPPLDHNGQPVRGNGYVTDDFTDHAISFIRENQSKPFFCYVAFNTPHSPMQAPDRNYDPVATRELTMFHADRPNEKEDVAMTRAAIAMVENIDENLGRVLVELEKLQIADDTIVIYFNDNGPNSFRWNNGMRGRKGMVSEGGTRSPLIVRWPEKVPAGLRPKQMSAAIDLLPTLCALAGVPVENTAPLDGLDLSAQLTKVDTPIQDRMLYSHWGNRTALRDGTYLYINNGELFNLSTDPNERENLAKKEPERAKEMAKLVEDWLTEVNSKNVTKQRYFTVGHPNAALTTLPARDGISKGPNIRRSASAPNCSFFTGWSDSEDTISWDVELLKSGRYDISIEYTCPEACRGSRIEWSFGGKILTSTVDEPFESELYGADDDRVVRKGESYMKEFATHSLGSIDLTKATGIVRLKLLDTIAKPGLELRSITFTPADVKKQGIEVDRKTIGVLGWSLHIHPALLEDSPDKVETAVRLLAVQLGEIHDKLPPAVVRKLQQVPLYFSPKYPNSRGGAEYHPDSGWLIRNGRDARMASSIEFTNIDNFEAETVRMPNFALHELAHAYHHRVLPGGYGNAAIRERFDAVNASGIYSNVERWFGNGRPNTFEKAYAMSSPMEYFAETTEAYFSRNDFFPFDKDELLRHDPEMAAVLTRLWEVSEGN